jgi:hypothetical protein
MDSSRDHHFYDERYEYYIGKNNFYFPKEILVFNEANLKLENQEFVNLDIHGMTTAFYRSDKFCATLTTMIYKGQHNGYFSCDLTSLKTGKIYKDTDFGKSSKIVGDTFTFLVNNLIEQAKADEPKSQIVQPTFKASSQIPSDHPRTNASQPTTPIVSLKKVLTHFYESEWFGWLVILVNAALFAMCFSVFAYTWSNLFLLVAFWVIFGIIQGCFFG